MRKLLAYNLRLFAWLAARYEFGPLQDCAVVANYLANTKPDTEVIDAYRRTMLQAVDVHRDAEYTYYRRVQPDHVLMSRICEHIGRIVWNDTYTLWGWRLTPRQMWKTTRELCVEAMKLSHT